MDFVKNTIYIIFIGQTVILYFFFFSLIHRGNMEGSTKLSLKDKNEERNKEISSRAADRSLADSASTSLAAILDTAYTSTVDRAPTVNSGKLETTPLFIILLIDVWRISHYTVELLVGQTNSQVVY